ncbi:energy-coupling factor transporter transmembrane component T family protein [Nakamurella sp.]|uniref:energy-coupling factor transporter transmembrane component T family protein n=1 Tax=Nakamurella sp. TaxID=1869182 RepID=UPI003B3A2099
MIGLYQPGDSLLHRLPAGWKLLVMLLAIVGIVLLGAPWQLGVAAVVVAGGFVLARIPLRVAWSQLWPMRWFLLFIAIFQVIFTGWERALMTCGTLLLTVAIAALITLTTRVTEMLDVCQRLLGPWRRFGVDPDRAGLVLALTIRCIPLMVEIVGAVSQARKARGASFSLRALVVPSVVRALRRADAIGDALTARGVDD